MHVIMKTICLILRVTVQKLSAESGLACDFMHLHICCERVPVQLIAAQQPASPLLAHGNQI